MRQLVLFILAAALAACGGSSNPCEGVTGTCVAVSPDADRAAIQEQLINIHSGSTLAFPAGTFNIDGELDLAVDGVTIQGAGMDQTILSFANQTTGAQGLYVTSNAFTMQDIALQDSPGDLLKLEGSNGVTIQRVSAGWTGGPSASNGSYALYPVQCSNVHVLDSEAFGASDTGVYVGQSDNIIIEGNTVHENVAGIEIENSTHADVHDNESHDNSGGILVFSLPGLQVENGSGARVYNNNIHDNNTTNFAPVGNIVGKVPTGTGIALLATHDVEVFGNTISNHKSVNLGIVNYNIIETPTDPNYDPYPYSIYVHDNTFTGTSTMPTGELGALLILALAEVQTSVVVPDVVWDGVVTPQHVDGSDPTKLAAGYEICIKNNGDADFGNLHWPNGDALQAEVLTTLTGSPYDCTHPALPAVVLQ